MKRCPQCRRDYHDDTLIFCLDDGSKLLDGPGSGSDPNATEQPTQTFEPSTKIFEKVPAGDEGQAPARKLSIWPIAGAALLVFALAAFGLYKYRSTHDPVKEIRSVAVLPLENLSGDPSQEYFADGMTESIIANLSKIGALKVISRTSVMRYKRSGKTIPEIARELGVEAVVEGSVQRTDNRIRVTAQLIAAETDSPVWSQQFERPMSDILNLQSEIARALTTEIKIKLTPEEQLQLNKTKTVDPAASEAYLLGKHYFAKWTVESERQAVEHFQKAVSIEPEYADAWAGLADAWTVRAMVGDITASEAEKPTRDATLRALEIDPNNAAAHISICFVRNNYDFDWAAAEASCKRGIELDPNNAKGHFAYAYLLSRSGRHSEIDVHMQNAMRLDPAEPWWPAVYGAFLVQAGRFDDSERQLKRSLEIDPKWTMADYELSNLYVETGRFDEARKAAEKCCSTNGIHMAYIYARTGNRQKALDILRQPSGQDFLQQSYGRVLVFTALDDFDEAFEVLERTLNEGNGFMFGYGNYRVLDKLKTDPRWEPIRQRMNLPE